MNITMYNEEYNKEIKVCLIWCIVENKVYIFKCVICEILYIMHINFSSEPYNTLMVY